MADKAFEANKAAILDEYARQLIGKADDVIAEARKRVEQKLLEQEQIEQLLERKKQLEYLLHTDPNNQSIKEILEQINRFLAQFSPNPED